MTTSVRMLSTALRALLALTVILGLAYPALIVGIGRIVPREADGSLIYDGETVIGSSLIGQDFSSDLSLFQSRPSAAGDNGYDPTSSGASNLAPTNEELAANIASAKEEIAQRDGVDPAQIPADALTASASGLDPHISPAYAELQIARVAERNNMSESDIRALVSAHTETPALGFVGQPRVNVLELNLALLKARGE